ncbi:CHAP domain-containing protein [Bifidobacterium platyrrhinorum]|uniref:CHAP domain-containing protein n=1 Tax=Bifidobacterium platyrrhinorum TaxID=2661628 RepID=A0A6L9SVZ7_9BIFI|nr:CHAP domain-containing protein [Bifidobacterium platyrrhinorum]NEG56195.1 CHAP domain-containing protein [Bifidobacterium platyrrhinorum]
MMAVCGLAMTSAYVPEAKAVSVYDYQQKVASQANIKAKLAGVNADLANQIIELNSLANEQIPAAQEAATKAQQASQQAQALAEATNERLEAAKKDKADLEEKIKQTGIEYDDAKDSVAEMARSSFHGSEASTVMDVVTNATTTDDFVNQMQSDAAATRSAANAANDAAVTMNTSMNRKERLAAIEEQITQLKNQADQQAASAQRAAEDAAAKQASLEALQAKGTAARASLEAQKSSLTSQAAKEAADIVSIQAQLAAQGGSSAGGYTPGSGGQQQSGGNSGGSTGGGSTGGNSGNSGGNSGGSGNSGGASGMNYAVPGSCPEGSGYCYGHNTGNTVGGSAYPARQCTLWAYIKRSQLSLPVGSYMGNGGQWADTARGLGYYVNNTPHVGAAMVFLPGQSVGGHWTADWQYGHVAVVERVNSDGSVLISEGGTGFATFPAWETISNSGAYQYIHY